MSGKIVLTYFNSRQRGEFIRWILCYAGRDFVDKRIEWSEWAKNRGQNKLKTPFGQLPYIEMDGKILAQSHAIGRYLARQHGCAGQDAWEEAQVDAIADYTKDTHKKFTEWLQAADAWKDPKADAVKQQFLTVHMVGFLKNVGQLVQNGLGHGFVVGSAPTPE